VNVDIGDGEMSRIDEALRQAARDERKSRDPRTYPMSAQAAGVIEPVILDGYPIEPAGTPPRETVRERREAASQPLRAGTPSRPIAIPPALENKLVVGRDASSLTIEQYRRLAAVLHDFQEQHGLKTLTVTSAQPQEGKTLTVTNLALTLSESYHQRVLLVDADLRRPSIHDLFGIQNGAGLSDLISNGGSSMPVVEISSGLSILTAGRHLSSPLAMLTSDRMRTIIADASTQFDWVLLDTPPVGFLPDAQLVARLSEGILFVIAAGVTPYGLVQRAIAELGTDRIVGTVLNRVEKRMLGANDYSCGGYYGGQRAEAGLPRA
jgi:protein-tyrosine kinase